MTHLTYIIAAYALAVLIGAVFAIDALGPACAARGAGWPPSTRRAHRASGA